MKSLFPNIILCTAFLLSAKAFPQEYIPMDFEKGIWFEESFQKEGDQEWIHWYCKGDTLVNDQRFYKLFRNIVTYSWIGELDTIIGQYFGLIRNSENRQVILKSFYSDSVLYDFNLSVGDTIHGIYDDFIVNAIDSVEICGKYHKRFVDYYGVSPFQLTLIEGIGFSNGFLGRFEPFLQGESTRWMYCYTEKNNPNCPECESPLGIRPAYSNIKVYPNPARDHIIIQSEIPLTGYTIFNLTGQAVIQKSLDNQLQAKESVAELPSGLFLIKTVFDNFTSTITQFLKE
jgi:hypothetical protein